MNTYEPFKYATEAGVSFILNKGILCQQDEFKEYEKPPYLEALRDCNIYFICHRNRVGIKPNAIQTTRDSVNLTFQVWEGDSKFEVPISLNNTFNSTNLSIVSKSPHNFFKLVNENGRKVYENKASYALDDHKGGIFPPPDFLDFEVLYIGKGMDDLFIPVMLTPHFGDIDPLLKKG